MSPLSQDPRRPRLGTVLSRRNWEDRRVNSTASSVTSHGSIGESTGGSFDPENEALVSTGPLNRSTLMKDSQHNLDDRGYQIDMKATKAVFSEGSETGSDAADISVEIGRGGRHTQKPMDDSRNGDSVQSSNAMIGDYKVMYSPPLSIQQHPARSNNNEHARRLGQDAQIRLASVASQKENRDPALQPFKSFNSSHGQSKLKRRTLGEINARASEMYDRSLLDDDRPTRVAPATRTTRFSRSKDHPSKQAPVSITDPATEMADVNQSYILPDLPNISQLMSGTIQDSNPGRTRRPAHPALSHTPQRPVYRPIDAVPIPEDERAIFVSLNFLQGKVSHLEAATVEFQKTIEDLKTKNLVLKAEKRRLRADNDILRKENLELRMGNAQTHQQPESKHQNHGQESPQKQRRANASAQVYNEVSKILKERQNEELFSLTPTESVKLRPASVPPHRGNTDNQKSTAAIGSKAQANAAASNSRQDKKVVIEENATRTSNSDGHPIPREQTSNQDMTYLSTQPGPHYLLGLRKMLEAERVDAKKRKTGRESQQSATAATSRVNAAALPSTAQPPLPQRSSMKDTSQRLRPSESAAATLARVRAEGGDAPRPANVPDISEDVTDQVSQPLPHIARRNSDPTVTAASNTSRRRRRTADFENEDMTSGVILPDITIAQPAGTTAATGTSAHLTDMAQHVIHSTGPHDAANCIICSRLTNSFPPTNKTDYVQTNSVTIPKPVPVSNTPVSSTPDNPDPTIRPAQHPGVALAIVLKELHDQHEHLKARLSKAQARYQQTDPRLSRKKRVGLSREIEGLQRKCDGVADMIYRLHDVLEGQKAGAGGDGLEMSADEVEVTVNGLREVMRGMSESGESESESDDGEHTD